jgi:hypothetical protein
MEPRFTTRLMGEISLLRMRFVEDERTTVVDVEEFERPSPVRGSR